jgi:hypothetical protein
MPRSDEFIARFWATELARLGEAQDSFINECEFSIASYDQFWKLGEQKAQ